MYRTYCRNCQSSRAPAAARRGRRGWPELAGGGEEWVGEVERKPNLLRQHEAAPEMPVIGRRWRRRKGGRTGGGGRGAKSRWARWPPEKAFRPAAAVEEASIRQRTKVNRRLRAAGRRGRSRGGPGGPGVLRRRRLGQQPPPEKLQFGGGRK